MAELQKISQEYQLIQNQLSNAVEARQRLDAQLTENEAVWKEFQQLTPNNTVYKLMGPVLVPQEQNEAKQNVQKRLEFIRGEIKRLETQLKDLGKKSDKKRDELVAIQATLQQSQEGPAA